MHKEFTSHVLNERGKRKARSIAEAFDTLLHELLGTTSDEFTTSAREVLCNEKTREFSLVKTQLEIASFYAMKAMALDPDNQEKVEE